MERMGIRHYRRQHGAQASKSDARAHWHKHQDCCSFAQNPIVPLK